jgi:hypothetical protein
MLATEAEYCGREVNIFCRAFPTFTLKRCAEILINCGYSQVHTEIPTQKFR